MLSQVIDFWAHPINSEKTEPTASICNVVPFRQASVRLNAMLLRERLAIGRKPSHGAWRRHDKRAKAERVLHIHQASRLKFTARDQGAKTLGVA